MSNDSTDNTQSSIILTLVIIMILAPMGLVFYFSGEGPFWYVQILAVSWFANIEAYNFYIGLHPFMMLQTLPFSFIRIGFVYMIWRAYRGKTTKSRAIRVGIGMELWFTLLYYLPYAMSLLLNPMWYMALPLAIPIPILLLVGWIAIKFRPPSETLSSWVDEEQPEHWWERNNQ